MAIKNTNFSFEKIDSVYKSAKKIFFIGIGGVSMSALATYCLYDGKEVFGYDSVRSDGARKLEKLCHIKYSSTPDSVCSMDLVIYSNAIAPSCFEYKKAQALNILTVSRANFLGYIISKYKNKIGISGTHGKSTTVSYLAKIFEYASLSPCVFCGATMRDYDSVLLYNKKDTCIFEACEYMDSFLNLPSDITGILNVDYDHPDYFPSLEAVKASFSKFAQGGKSVFINLDTHVWDSSATIFCSSALEMWFCVKLRNVCVWFCVVFVTQNVNKTQHHSTLQHIITWILR